MPAFHLPQDAHVWQANRELRDDGPAKRSGFVPSQVIILDLSLQSRGLAGLTLISRIRRRDIRTPILVFSMHSDPIIVRRALDAGASGYLLGGKQPAELVRMSIEYVATAPMKLSDAPTLRR